MNEILCGFNIINSPFGEHFNHEYYPSITQTHVEGLEIQPT
jgi:hypothetical protein